ncbi:hypothetical protein [Limnohabitans sp. Jir72]|uniref:hypothetical protein n=1 Tax=Limnohabitans sp. Jir72 TaxID=1977909 RepID=UPI000D333F38|nr:hypothetical protein [Limnohabitans sp. Jir72]PUE31734.1 hypothetical protein B9Z52_09595 [Limnohabitans sp. Jir72]
MVNKEIADGLYTKLQSAITSKLRSLTHTDAIRKWEQELRRYVIGRLCQEASSHPEMTKALNNIPAVDLDGGVKLAILLNQLTSLTGLLQKKSKFPLPLMQAIMIKPMNVQAALDHLQRCDFEKLASKQKYCANILKAELMGAAGRMQEAYTLLKPLLDQKGQTLELRLSCSMRFAKLARSRNTIEAQTTLHAVVRQIEQIKPSQEKWQREFAESAHELASLSYLCGHHQRCVQWAQRALQIWNRLLLKEPELIDLLLLQAGSLRTLSLAQEELGETQLSQASMAQATDIIQTLLTAHPDNSSLASELPKSHDVKGDIHLANLDLDKALQAYSASAALGAHLSFRDPINVRWKLEELASAMRIAKVLKKMGRLQDALKMLPRYLTQLEALIALDPENLEYRTTAAQLHIQAGDMHWQREDHHQAEVEFRFALTALNYAIEHDSHHPRWVLMYLMLMQRLSELEMSKGGYEKAFELLSKAQLVISQAMNQNVHARKLSQFFVAINTRLSDCAFDSGKVSIGMEIQKKTLQQATQYQRERPESMAWLTLLCRIQTHAASHYLKLGMMQESRELWEKAIASLSQQCALHPENMEVSDYLVRAQLVKIEWLCQTGDLTQAHQLSLILMTQIRVSQKDLSDDQPRQAMLCECLEHFVFCCHHLKKSEQELAALNELERIRKAQLQICPDSVPLQSRYFDLLLSMGRNAFNTGMIHRGIACMNQALKGYNDLHEKHHEQHQYLLAIGDILVSLGQAYQKLNNASASQLTLDKALQVANWLGKAGHDSYVMQLAAAKIFFAVSQSNAYEVQKMDLLTMAENQLRSVQVHLQNPAVNALMQIITAQQQG